MEERLLTPKDEIVVYQPSETLRLEVRLQDGSIWLPQQKIADLLGVKKAAISKHLKNIFATGELHEELVVSKMETTTRHGGHWWQGAASSCRPRFRPRRRCCVTGRCWMRSSS